MFKTIILLLVALCSLSPAGAAPPPSPAEQQALRYKFEQQRQQYVQLQSQGVDMTDLDPLIARLRYAKDMGDWEEFTELLDRIERIQAQKLRRIAPSPTPPPAPPSTREAMIPRANDTAIEDADLREFGFGIGYLAAAPVLAAEYAKIGILWGKTGPIQWADIEPAPPTRGDRHDYQWELIDRLVSTWQNAGMRNIVIWLKCNAPWATVEPPLPPGLSPDVVKAARKVGRLQRVSSVPREDMWRNYEAFVESIVERFDGDGNNDMPGLKYPVNFFEIESEAQHAGQWYGSSDDYLRLLKSASLAARKASREVKIVLSGFTFEDLMDDMPSESTVSSRLRGRPGLAEGMRFNAAALRHPELFDAVEFHYLTDYRSAYGIVDWIRGEMRKNGYEKPIWALDAFSGPLIFHSELNTPFPNPSVRQELLAALRDRSHPQHRIVDDWFRREQSAIMTKKFIIGMELGMAGIVMGNSADWVQLWDLPSEFEKSTAPMGLIGVEMNDGKPTPGKRRPAYYTLKMLCRELQGKVSRVERMAAPDGIYAYRLSTSLGPLHALWYEKGPVKGPTQSERKRIHIRSQEKEFERLDIITEYGREEPERGIQKLDNGRTTLELGEVPVFLKGLQSIVLEE